MYCTIFFLYIVYKAGVLIKIKKIHKWLINLSIDWMIACRTAPSWCPPTPGKGCLPFCLKYHRGAGCAWKATGRGYTYFSQKKREKTLRSKCLTWPWQNKSYSIIFKNKSFIKEAAKKRGGGRGDKGPAKKKTLYFFYLLSW